MAITNKPGYEFDQELGGGGGSSSTTPDEINDRHVYRRLGDGTIIMTGEVIDPIYYVYTNIEGTFSLQKDIYPYVKINGRYYENDGDPFTLYGDKSALVMDKKKCYQSVKGEGELSIVPTNRTQNLTKINSPIYSKNYIVGEKLNKYNYVVSVPNYNINNESVCGTISQGKEKLQQMNFKYPQPLDGATSPDFWNFIPGCPRVIMDRTMSHDNTWTIYNNTVTSGKSEKLYGINNRTFNKGQAKELVAFDEKVSGVKWYWFTGMRGDGTEPEKITRTSITYPNQTKTVSRISSLRRVYSFELINGSTLAISDLVRDETIYYNINSKDKIVLARRPLTSIQRALDSISGRRFCSVVFEQDQSYWNFYTFSALPAWTEQYINKYLSVYRDIGTFGLDLYDTYDTIFKGDSNEKVVGSRSYNEVNLNISLENFYYIDITEALQKEQRIFLRSDNLFENDGGSLVDIIQINNPIFKEHLERPISSLEGEFQFEPAKFCAPYERNRAMTCLMKNNIVYKIKINNIKSFSDYQPEAINKTPTLDFQTANLELSNHSYTWKSAAPSVGMMLQYYFKWNIPNFFSENFLDLWIPDGFFFGSWMWTASYYNMWFLQGRHQHGDASESPVIFDNPSSAAVIDSVDYDGYRQVTCSVAGWDDWYYENNFHLFPSSTSRSAGTPGSPTWYCSQMTYAWAPEEFMSSRFGVQLGTTVGINLGLNSINATKSVGDLKGEKPALPSNTFQNFAVIVCENY